MGDCMQFRANAAQTACLRFVVDVINLDSGFIGRSPAPADADALSRAQLIDEFAEDAVERCSRAGLGQDAIQVMERALQQSRGALLGEVCSTAARAKSSHESVSWGLGELAALVGNSAAETKLATLPVCGVLAHVYSAQPFRDWWGDPDRSRSPERLQWLQFRAKGIALTEYLRENRQAIAVLERSVEQQLHAIYNDVAASETAVDTPHTRNVTCELACSCSSSSAAAADDASAAATNATAIASPSLVTRAPATEGGTSCPAPDPGSCPAP